MTKYLDINFDLNEDILLDTLDELPFWSAPFGIRLLEHVILKKNITVLDIGFGTGFPLIELAMRLGQTCKVYGIDPWEGASKRTEKKINSYGIKNIEIIKNFAENIPLINTSVDLITSNNGINNVSDQEKVIKECYRILKKGGQFVQTINLNETFTEFYTILREVLLDKNVANAKETIENHIYLKRKPVSEIETMLNYSGFSILHMEYDAFKYNFADGTTLLNHYFIQLAFLQSWKDLVPEHLLKEVFNEVEERINSISAEKGFFSMSVPFLVIDCCKK